MIRLLVPTVVLAAIYLLVLGSTKPGDVGTGLVLGALVTVALRPLAFPPGPAEPSRATRVRNFPRLVGALVADITRGTIDVSRYSLGLKTPDRAGYVEIPLGERSQRGAIAWGILTTISPGEVVVDIDEERGVALLHLLDASDPDAIRARHQERWEQLDRKVIP